jgi:transposase
MPYSVDLRARAVAAVYDGMSKVKVCKIFSICRRTLYSWLALKEAHGSLEPAMGFQKGHSHGIKDLEAFRVYVEAHPDLTQEEMAAKYQVGSSTIGRALKKIGYSRKKKSNLR